MTTVTDQPPAGTRSGLRLAAMQALAGGTSSQNLQDAAASPRVTAIVAALRGITPEEAAELMLGVALMTDVLAREGITPEQCRFLLRGDERPALSLAPSAA